MLPGFPFRFSGNSSVVLPGSMVISHSPWWKSKELQQLDKLVESHVNSLICFQSVISILSITISEFKKTDVDVSFLFLSIRANVEFSQFQWP